MAILALLLLTLRLLPVTNAWEREIGYRVEIAEACAEATEDPTERYLCAKIPRFESSYREDVGRCRVKGSAGELGAWQILPRDILDRMRLCRSLKEDAVVAIERIRESRNACRRLPKAEQLGLYTRGSCTSEEGRRLSRHRWPYEKETRGLNALDALDPSDDAIVRSDDRGERSDAERARARAERRARRLEIE